MDTLNTHPNSSAPKLDESGSYLKAATLTWIGILCFVIAIPLFNYLRFPFISSIGLLMLIGLAFWSLIRKAKSEASSSRQLAGQKSAEAEIAGLRTARRETNYEQLNMDDEITKLNQRRIL